ncbi:hypothetical protein [Curtobacterium sp. MMLR14_010]|uniref:hypothetical protein n=1 Tax=Curtobacterium sp. MMLR14_010 TaxID=1898743 RepID=UPI0011143DA6|nr:hypothetical protein [Curtobacterium sp. MMLR14_010]
MTDFEGIALADLSDDALAHRRRELVREYDRAVRAPVRDQDLVARIWGASAAIADEQQERQPVRFRRDEADWLSLGGAASARRTVYGLPVVLSP